MLIGLHCRPLVAADGNYLLSCGSDKSLKLWSVTRGTPLKTYSGHGYEVLDVDGYGIAVLLHDLLLFLNHLLLLLNHLQIIPVKAK